MAGSAARGGKVAAESLPVARVAVDVSLPHLDRPFDYLVPEKLSAAAVPGCRVRVRFAGLTGGYLLQRVDKSEHEGGLAFLERVVSPEPVLTAEMFGLARAVADRYGGTLADVLRLAIPPRHAATESAAVGGGVAAAAAAETAAVGGGVAAGAVAEAAAVGGGATAAVGAGVSAGAVAEAAAVKWASVCWWRGRFRCCGWRSGGRPGTLGALSRRAVLPGRPCGRARAACRLVRSARAALA